MLSRITPTDSALREQAPPPSAPAGASTDATSSDTFQSCLAVIATPVITAARAQDPAPRGSAQPPPKADWRVLDAMALVVPPPGTEEASTQTPVLPAPGPLNAKATPDPATPETAATPDTPATSSEVLPAIAPLPAPPEAQAAEDVAAASASAGPVAAAEPRHAPSAPHPSGTATPDTPPQTLPVVDAPPRVDAPQPVSGRLPAAAMPRVLPPEAVPMTIASMAREGVTHVEIRLDPAELGRVEVRLSIDHEGAIRTHIVVERPETLQLLRADSPRLDQAYSAAGLSAGDTAFSLSGEAGRERAQPWVTPAGAPASDPAPGLTPVEPATRVATAASRLDLLI